MPSSAAARITRIAISERLATRSEWIACIVDRRAGHACAARAGNRRNVGCEAGCGNATLRGDARHCNGRPYRAACPGGCCRDTTILPGRSPRPVARRAPNGYESGCDAPPAQASDDISMKSPIVRLLAALPGFSIAVLLAACGGSDGGGAPDPGDCCYVYPDPIVVPPGGDGVDP